MRAPEVDRVRLIHILDAIRELETNAYDITEQRLDEDAMIRYATVKLIEVIGEAANMLTKELRQAHPEVPWPLIIGMRKRLVHDYFRIDTTVVAEVVREHIPPLKLQVETILRGLPAG